MTSKAVPFTRPRITLAQIMPYDEPVDLSVVLFGAGASRGQTATGEPPLMDSLYSVLAETYPSWKAEQATFEGSSFETAMADLLRSDEALQSETKQWDSAKKHLRLKWPAAKLRSTELQWDLAEFFGAFELKERSLYERFCRRACDAIRAKTVCLATLNYDALLFRALDRPASPTTWARSERLRIRRGCVSPTDRQCSTARLE